MDVSKFQIKGEWLELEVKSKKVIGPLKFLVKPLSSDDQLDMADIGRDDKKQFLNTILDLVLDWNLTQNGQKLPCDAENKELYLKYLIPMNLKEKEEEKEKETKEIMADEDLDKPKPARIIPDTVGLSILGFAQDFSNFIKN
ncbi:MAG: hypothetical protein KAR42_16715 [candidate division Zixibacteria bacterium]|nr:hypothetical protein [candidate division Zixibacteria bacterium]